MMNMNTEHLTAEQVVRYQNDEMTMAERAMMYVHMCSCEECTALIEQAKKLKYMAQHMQEEDEAAEEDMYLAVAGPNGGKRSAVTMGTLNVTILPKACGYVIADFDCAGIAEKYALNLSEDGTALVDDGDLLRIEIKNGAVTVTTDDDVCVGGRILSADGGDLPMLTQLNLDDASLALPAGRCTLELVVH